MTDAEEIDTAECWALMEEASLGRFAVDGIDGSPQIFPVNYTVHTGNLYLRSSAGSKLHAIMARPDIAFEIDGESDHHRWSVMIRGIAHRVTSDEEAQSSGVLTLITADPTPKHEVIRLTPRSITGRRFPKPALPTRTQSPPARASRHTRASSAPRDGSLDKPHPIPHFPPFLASE